MSRNILRNDNFERMIDVTKFIPDRIIDKDKLIIAFLHHRKQDRPTSSSYLNNIYQNDNMALESISQLCQVADLLKIPMIESEFWRDLGGQLKRYKRQLILFIIINLDTEIVQRIKDVIYSGFQVIIGNCLSAIHKDEWRYYQQIPKEAVIVSVLQFIDLLLWEEFRINFRIARIEAQTISCLRDIIVPCMRELELGEPQFRLHFHESKNGIYIKEFALEIDWEVRETSRIKLVFLSPIKDRPKSLIKRLFEKSKKVYDFIQTDRIYTCLQIPKANTCYGTDICCSFTVISKDERGLPEITKQANLLKSEVDVREFYKQNTDVVLQIGEISHYDDYRKIYPHRTLYPHEWDDNHIREAISFSIKMIGDRMNIINI